MRVVELDPLRESGQRALISAHLAEGNVVEARRSYAACRRVLQTELGLAPSAGLTLMVESASDLLASSACGLCAACPLRAGPGLNHQIRTQIRTQ